MVNEYVQCNLFSNQLKLGLLAITNHSFPLIICSNLWETGCQGLYDSLCLAPPFYRIVIKTIVSSFTAQQDFTSIYYS